MQRSPWRSTSTCRPSSCAGCRRSPDVSLGIYDRWLRCQTLIRTFNLDIGKRATSSSREIIEHAPNFVPAYCGLADMHNTEHIVYPGKAAHRGSASNRRSTCAPGGRTRPVEHERTPLAGLGECHGRPAHAGRHAYRDGVRAQPQRSVDAFFSRPAVRLLRRERPLRRARAARARHGAGAEQDALGLPGRHPFPERRLRRGHQASEHALDYHRTVRAWRAASFAHLDDLDAAAAEMRKFLQSIGAGWFGAAPVTDRAVARWLLHLYPINDTESWQRLRTGLEKAGLPHAEIEFMDWR